MMARGTEARSSQYCERSGGRGWPGYWLGLAIYFACGSEARLARGDDDKRDRHEVTHRELNGSSMFMSRSILFDTDAMQPRAAKDARGTTSTAQPPLPRCS